MTTLTSTRWQAWVTVLLAVLILIPSGYGFLGKFVELVRLARGQPDGAFAVAPVVNYLLASLGFFCLLLWAAAHGMFRDIERPKYELLAREARLEGLDLEESLPPRPETNQPPKPDRPAAS
jgi:hypothetical protein